MEILQDWALEEKLFKETWALLIKWLKLHPNILEELWYESADELSEVKAYMVGRKYMFNHWFRRNYHLWFYKKEEWENLTK